MILITTYYLLSSQRCACMLADLLLISRMEEEQNSTPGQTRYTGISAVVQLEASY